MKDSLKKVNNKSERYIELPVLSPGKHHKIFNKYLLNLLVENKISKKIIGDCNTSSKGAFKIDLLEGFSQEVYDKVWKEGWHKFKNKRIKEIANKWFKEHGYLVNWK